LYRDFKILLNPDDEPRNSEEWGRCSVQRGEIHLAPKAPPHVMPNTMIHEIVHALIAEMGLKDYIKHEEKLTNFISNGLATVIRDNKILWLWVIDSLSEENVDENSPGP